MANPNAPFGLSPLLMNGKEPPTNVYAPAGYCIASGYSTGIRYGDLVKLTGTSNLAADSRQYMSGVRPTIAKSAAGDTHTGVFAGVEYTDANGVRQFSKFWTASATGKDIVAYVYDHENTVFMAQYAGKKATTDNAFDVSDVGRSMLITIGTSSTQVSDSVVSAAASTAASDDLLCLGLSNLASQVTSYDSGTSYPDKYDYAIINVLIRTHRMRGNGVAGYPVNQ